MVTWKDLKELDGKVYKRVNNFLFDMMLLGMCILLFWPTKGERKNENKITDDPYYWRLLSTWWL